MVEILKWSLFGITCLTVGFVIPTGDFAILWEEISFHYYIAAILAMCVLILAGMFVRRWVLPDVEKIFTKVVRECIARDGTIEEHLGKEEVKRDVAELLAVFVVGRAYWRTILALGGVLGSMLVAAQLMALLGQNERLDTQNGLLEDQEEQIQKQTDLMQAQSESMISQKAVALFRWRHETLLREREFEEKAAREALVRVLEGLDTKADIDAQVIAIHSVIDTMLMSVDHLGAIEDQDHLSGWPTTTKTYPNLETIFDEFIRFLRSDRPIFDVEIGRVSDAILATIRTMGFDGGSPEANTLWDLLGDRADSWWDVEDYDPIDPVELEQAVALARIAQQGSSGQLDFRRVPGAFDGAMLPHADFEDADLRGVVIHNAVFVGADFSGADLSNSRFGYINLYGSNCSDTNLNNARWEDVNASGSWFDSTKMNGMFIENSRFVDARFEHTEMYGTIIHDPVFVAASFYESSLSGSVFVDPDLRGTQFALCDMGATRVMAVINDEGALIMERFVWDSDIDRLQSDIDRLQKLSEQTEVLHIEWEERGTETRPIGEALFGVDLDDTQESEKDGGHDKANTGSAEEDREYQIQVYDVPAWTVVVHAPEQAIAGRVLSHSIDYEDVSDEEYESLLTKIAQDDIPMFLDAPEFRGPGSEWVLGSEDEIEGPPKPGDPSLPDESDRVPGVSFPIKVTSFLDSRYGDRIWEILGLPDIVYDSFPNFVEIDPKTEAERFRDALFEMMRPDDDELAQELKSLLTVEELDESLRWSVRSSRKFIWIHRPEELPSRRDAESTDETDE